MATDFFLKIEGIPGESQDAKHSGEIEVDQFSWGAEQTGTAGAGGGAGAGKVRMGDFNFSCKANKSSPKLFLACATGEHIKSAVLVCRKAGKEQQEYLKLTMTGVLVSSYQTGGPGGGPGELPADQVSLNFAKIEYEYKEQKADGTLGGAVKSSYDLKTQKES